MPLRTTDDRPILRVNGIQTQSESYLDLLAETPRLIANGVSHLRLMPQAVDMVAVASAFRGVLDGTSDPLEAETALRKACGDVRFSNGFYYGEAGYRRMSAAAAS
jgi:collagenase-like PrtC family protease